jgi:hypothetical protein
MGALVEVVQRLIHIGGYCQDRPQEMPETPETPQNGTSAIFRILELGMFEPGQLPPERIGFSCPLGFLAPYRLLP